MEAQRGEKTCPWWGRGKSSRGVNHYSSSDVSTPGRLDQHQAQQRGRGGLSILLPVTTRFQETRTSALLLLWTSATGSSCLENVSAHLGPRRPGLEPRPSEGSKGRMGDGVQKRLSAPKVSPLEEAQVPLAVPGDGLPAAV